MRSVCLLPLLCTAVIGSSCGGGAPDRAGDAPDLLLLTVDTLRADALACYGGEPDVGKVLCSIADHGVRYEWALSTAPSTAPSVASILTSLYPGEHGVTQFAVSWLDDESVTVAEVLAEAGYATGAVVSNPVLDESRQMGQGFESYDARTTRREANRLDLGERVAEATTDAGLAWLDENGPSLFRERRPRFLWIHYQDPHGPYTPPGAESPGLDTGALALPILEDNSGKEGVPGYQVIEGLRSVEAYTERYRAEIRYLDRHVARLLAALPDAGVLLTADHGEAFGEDGYYLAHGHSVGLELIRVPLLWRPPGGIPPDVVRVPVGGVDVAPTLLAAAGLTPPASFRGRPLPIPDTEARQDRLLFAEHRARAAIIAGDLYYARDHQDLSEAPLDRISGGRLEPLPPRMARLRGPQPPSYEATSPAASAGLDRALRSHLEAESALPSAGGEPSEAMREELRALGYLE